MKNKLLKICKQTLTDINAYKIVVKQKQLLKKQLKKYSCDKIFVVGFGKAAYDMAAGIERLYPKKISDGIIITKYRHIKGKLKKIQVFEAAHPIPDKNGVKATKKTIEILKTLKPNTLVIFLISGGGSALLVQPKEGITLAQLKKKTDQLIKSGVDISKINKTRKKLSQVKDGKLLKFLPKGIPALSLIVSDVVGDDLKTIASGPTVPKLYRPKLKNKIILNNRYAIDMVANYAKKAKLTPLKQTKPLTGDVSKATKQIINKIISIQNNKKIKKPACYIWGGETTVIVKGNGKGGRNTELALRVAQALKELQNISFVSLGTDGTDGPTDAAGAYVDNNTYDKAIKSKLSPEKYLKNNDSYNFFKKTGDLIITGPTGTNVMDLQIAIIK